VDGDGENEYCLLVTDNNNDTIYVPLWLSEEIKTVDLPELPFIEMHLTTTLATPHDVMAAVRKYDVYIDLNVRYADTDNIDSTSFGKKIADEIVNQVRTNQSVVTNTFMNIMDESKVMQESSARQVVFHRVLTLYVWYSDAC